MAAIVAMGEIMQTTTIQLGEKNRDVLKSIGKKGETYDQIMTRLLKHYLGYINFMNESYHILETEENWTNLDDL